MLGSRLLTRGMVDMRDCVASVAGRERQMQPCRCNFLSWTLVGYSRDSKRDAEQGGERASERVADDPDLGVRVGRRDVVVEVRPE